jgi:hypothetical protein
MTSKAGFLIGMYDTEAKARQKIKALEFKLGMAPNGCEWIVKECPGAHTWAVELEWIDGYLMGELYAANVDRETKT